MALNPRIPNWQGQVVWLVGAQLAVVPVFMLGLKFPLFEALMQSMLYAGISGFVFITSLVALQQSEAREEQRRGEQHREPELHARQAAGERCGGVHRRAPRIGWRIVPAATLARQQRAHDLRQRVHQHHDHLVVGGLREQTVFVACNSC